MKNKTLLILFTYKYPYNPPTEQFLDDELHFLDKNIDVLLVPISRDNNGQMYDTVKSNEHFSVCNAIRNNKIKEIIKGIFFTCGNIKMICDDFGHMVKVVDRSNLLYAIKDTLKFYVQGGALFYEVYNKIYRYIRKEYSNYVLYSYWLNPMVLAEALCKARLKKRYKTKVKAFARAHGDGDLYHKGLDRYRPCVKLFNNEIDCFAPISDSGTVYLKNQGIINVKTFRLGVECRHFIKQDIDTNLIVSCSVINTNKRVNLIAEALTYIKKPVKWIHFGGGAEEKDLICYCKKILPNNVTWVINGWTGHNEIMRFYEQNKPDLFVNVSKMEGIPVSIMEALSFSIPCVGTDVGAVKEIIDDNNGYLVADNTKPYNISSIIDNYLNKSLDDKNKMRLAAFNTITNYYDSHKNYTSFLSYILSD